MPSKYIRSTKPRNAPTGICAITWATYGILTKDSSLWSVLAILATSFVGYVTGTAKFCFSIVGKFRTYMSTHSHRILELESARDPDRSSSGLLPDGSPPHDN